MEALRCPLAGGVDAHLAAVVGQTRRVIQRVNRPHCELDITLRIDVVRHPQRDFAYVVYIAVFIHHDDALGKHGLPQRPDGAHDLARLSRIAFTNGHNHQVVEDRLRRQVDVDNLRRRESDQRQENALDGKPHPCILHRRLAYDGRGIDRILAMCDAGDMEDRIVVGKRVETSVIAEGPFGAQLAELDIALQNNLRMGGHLEIHRLALHQLHRRLPQESRDDVLLDLGRRGHNRGEGRRRISADGYRHFHTLAAQIGCRHRGHTGDGAGDARAATANRN